MSGRPAEELHVVVAGLLERMVGAFEDQRRAAGRSESWTHFHAKCLPQISLYDYLSRINRYAKCSPSCYVLSIIYLDRALKRCESLCLSRYNVHRY